MAGLYIHIPFCMAKCRYCDFTSYPCGEWDTDSYVRALIREMSLHEGGQFDTVYIGGGTPSVLPSVSPITEALRAHFEITADAEITIEVNPASADERKLAGYREAGINRLSMGVQSFRDEELQALGRLHCAREAEETFLAARRAGFENINLDLIYGIPLQSPHSWRETLERAISLEPEHLSCYSLILEEDTPLTRAVEAGEVTLPDEEACEEMYLTLKKIGDADYQRYEVSNYARTGFQCRHNLNYWDNGQYLGLGCGAHSHWGSARIENVADPEVYARMIFCGQRPVAAATENTCEDEMFETVMMGLRKVEGLDMRRFAARFGRRAEEVYALPIRENEQKGLLRVDGDALRLTDRGMDLMNTVLLSFMK